MLSITVDLRVRTQSSFICKARICFRSISLPLATFDFPPALKAVCSFACRRLSALLDPADQIPAPVFVQWPCKCIRLSRFSEKHHHSSFELRLVFQQSCGHEQALDSALSGRHNPTRQCPRCSERTRVGETDRRELACSRSQLRSHRPRRRSL